MCARLNATLSCVSGKRELAKAIRDIRTRWGSLTYVLRNGRVCIDDYASERSMWPMTLVRKDWAFAGSESGGERELAIDTLTAEQMEYISSWETRDSPKLKNMAVLPRR